MNSILELSYEQWRENPVTVMFEKALRNHREAQLIIAVGNSTNPEVEDQQLRRNLVSIKNTDAVLVMLNDVNVLDRVANPPKEKQ